jgi:hypothetical protein
MKRVLLATCVILIGALAGCSVLDQPYSCGSVLNPWSVDNQGIRIPPTRNSAGYLHC